MNSTDASAPATPGQAVGLTFFGMAACTLGASLPWFMSMFRFKGNSLISPSFLASSFGFAGGAIVFGSIFDVLPGSVDAFASVDAINDKYSNLTALASTILGVVLFVLMEKVLLLLAPDLDCPCHGVKYPELFDEKHESVELPTVQGEASHPGSAPNSSVGEKAERDENGERDVDMVKRNATRTSWTILLAMTLHHIPEGIAFYLTATTDLQAGAVVGLILLIHVFPEGISLGTPTFVAFPKQRWRTTLYGAASGFGQPLGALIAYGAFSQDQPDNATLGIFYGAIAGMLLTIALRGLIPLGLLIDKRNEVVGRSALAGAGLVFFSISMFGVAGFNG